MMRMNIPLTGDKENGAESYSRKNWNWDKYSTWKKQEKDICLQTSVLIIHDTC